MARLTDSLAIALWIVGSTWAVALLALWFEVAGEIIWVAILVGLVAGVYEWLTLQRGPRK